MIGHAIEVDSCCGLACGPVPVMRRKPVYLAEAVLDGQDEPQASDALTAADVDGSQSGSV